MTETQRNSGPPDRSALQARIAALEAQLQAAEQRADLLDALVESSAEGITIAAADGQILRINPTGRRILGFPAHPHEAVDLQVFLTLSRRMPDGNPLPREWWPISRVLRGETVIGQEVRLLGVDGLERRLLCAGNPLKDADGQITHAVMSFRDITLLRKAEQALQESDQRFHSLYTAMREGMALHRMEYDADGAAVNYTLLDVNPQFEMITGLSREDVVNRLATEVYASPEAPYLAEYARVVATGESLEYETYFAPMDRWFWISVVAYEQSRFATIFLDITERKHTEAALAAEKERLAVTLRSIGDGVITTDIYGQIMLMNRVAEELTGWPYQEAVGQPLEDVFTIVNERTRQRAESLVARVLRSGGIVELDTHNALIARDGLERIIANSGAPICDRESRIIGVVLVFRDVTIETRLQADVQRAAKMESIGVLAGGIAHDFNNLLTAIAGNVGLAQMVLDAGDLVRANRYLSEAENATIRARDLTQQLLTFSRGGAPIKAQLDLETVLRESAQLSLVGSRNRCRLAWDTLWPISADAGQLTQVMNNLLLNADQAMPDPGEIVVRAANTEVTAKDGLPVPPGPYVKIDVSDHGIGMPPEVLGRIFDPFFTTKQRGSGLGLASAYSIVKAHEGYIAVESTPGHGSTFTLYLPAIPTAAPALEPEAVPDHPMGALRILIMDDEEAILDMLSHTLASLGHETTAVPDGEQAIAAYTAAMINGEPFDLVILDLTIPGAMGGKDAIRALSVLDPNVRALASSGYATDAIMANYADYGFAGRLAKPYRLAELHAAIRHLMSNSTPTNAR